MERFYKRALEPPFIIGKNNDSAKSSRDSFDAKDLPTDPGLRIQILEYNPNIRDEVRRAYISRGPCQPLKHNFPFTTFGKKSRRFNSNWFSEYANWLEYSISKDAAFCLCCYLFKAKSGEQANGDFVGEGFRNWKKGERLKEHVGGPNSAHNKAWAMCEALKNQKQLGPTAPPSPRDKIVIPGDGNVKAVFNEEHDIGAYTVKAAVDPRTLNKILYIKPPHNIYSFNELVACWEKKIGKTLEKIYVAEDELLKQIEESPMPVNVILSINHCIFVKGDQTYFEIDPAVGVEASQLYPEVKYTTVDEYITQFV